MDPRTDIIFTNATEIAERRQHAVRQLQAEQMRLLLAPILSAAKALRALWTSGLQVARRQRAG